MKTQRETEFVGNLMRHIALKYLCPAHACFLIDDSKDLFLDRMKYFRETCDCDL